ncbi:4Fe-4S binding protein [bacterium]|nr:4Fe-4S binding protein [bacterium]
MPEKRPPTIDPVRCSGCGRCVAACPERLITLETRGHRKNAILVEQDHCILCGACSKACPLGAISQPPFSLDFPT